MKTSIFLKCAVSFLALFLVGTYSLQGQITVDSDFEGGNGIATFTDVETNEVHIASEFKGGDTKNISYYVKISGLNPDMPLTLEVSATWRGHNIVYSYDNINWEKALLTNLNNFSVPLESSTVYIAHSYPYTYSDMLAEVDGISELEFVNTYDLAISEEGRPVKLVRITDDCVDDTKKELVWILGRIHAFENPGNHSVSGMIDYFTSSQPDAQRLREEAIIYVVPVMDVDMAYHGGSGKDQTPVDFNRDWYSLDHESHWNAVIEAKKWIDSTAALNDFSVFFDSHSPPPSQGTSLFYYVYDVDHHIANTRFVKETVKSLGNYQGDEFLMGALDISTSQDYAISIYDNPKLYNVTMETGFDYRPDGPDWTKELYLLHGEYHGQAISDYIHGHANENDVLVDNTDLSQVVTTGEWSNDSIIPGFFGDDYMYSDSPDHAQVVFNASIDTAGTYEVFTRWVSSPDFATNVQASFSHAGGVNEYVLDMSLRGGNWVSLDTFDFEAGEEVSLTVSNTNANQTVIADGLRISKVTACQILSVPEVEKEQNPSNFNLYPNPTTGLLNFEDKGLKIDKIVIVDIRGKVVKTITSFNNQIDVSDLSNGIFYIRVIAKEGMITKKIIKQ